MSRPVPRFTIIGSIVRKDMAEYGRDKLWAFLTAMVLIAVIALFWILPNDVNESIGVGVSGLDAPAALAALETIEEEGLRVVPFRSAQDLEAVVAGDAEAWQTEGQAVVIAPGSDPAAPDGADKANVAIGIAFPDDFFASTAAGQRTEVTVFVDAAVPDETQKAITSLVREFAFVVAGDELPVDTPDPDEVFVVLGEDRVGSQVTAREGFRPVFVFLILVMEMFVMASLIAKEIQERTVTAVLVTPATIGDVLAAKGIAGALSGMVQAVIVLVAIDSLFPQPVLVLTLMLLGSVMVSGTAMLAGSTGKDFMSTLFHGMVYMILLMIPAFAALFPGAASAWIRALPSYPLVRGLVNVSTYGDGWAETLPELAALFAWSVGLFAVGWVVLKRKVQTL
ncbi:MAG: ABC transporter permease [Acidimicrobiia bacterium]|nr:ABC transporter permease [Acidimicrobiia bacterium]